MIEIHSACSGDDEAQKIAKALLEKKLVACANFFLVQSLFWWEGKIEKESETLLVLKTKKANEKKVVEEIKKLHSYDLPVITVHTVSFNDKACDWINDVTV
ncbi:divalent-cation tolerance protein CutA [Candidatus Woesearchaeota archaeon]|nr:divalent-cation tolerance protein CutA [Candidatus Woesearchaeota archaeon]